MAPGKQDAAQAATFGNKPGDARFFYFDKNNDGHINQSDYVPIG